MKYIRTKDEVFILSTKHEHLAQEYGAIKVADTIEELCDEVCCDNEVQLLVNIYTNETKAQMIRNTIEQLFCKGKKDVYGAIWTDKGLIYVAKMNDKGELELL